MEEKRGAVPPDLAQLREWVLQLERRVDELESEAQRQQRAKRRGRLLMLVAGVLYVLVVYWEMTKLV